MSLHTKRIDRRTSSPSMRKNRADSPPFGLRPPTTAASSLLDLVDQRQVIVPPLPLNFVHADGLDAFQGPDGPVPTKPRVSPTRRRSPARAEGGGHLLPRQPLGPARQEPAIAGRQVALALAPRALAPPSRRTPDSPPAAWHRRNTRRSPTAARTRNAAPAAGRSPAQADRSPSRSAARSCGPASPLRASPLRVSSTHLTFP